MTVLLRLTEWQDGREYGLEQKIDSEVIEQANFSVLEHHYKKMKAVIQRDLDNARYQGKDTRWP